MTNYHTAFTLKEKRAIVGTDLMGYLFEHNQTKARVMFLLNDDEEKTFSITFQTTPYDDNGIAHILEHSVLCGSRKYPSKEPFIELAKGSLNTFLNAMTFDDRTMYPVSSRNNKDFYNLMDVYLDAVFFPNIYDTPEILEQEGWHYHLENANDDLTYNGVVYNEMKGAFSNFEEVIYTQSRAALFPDTIYRHCSGGYPLAIPSLTFEAFTKFHKDYYHPSNAYVTFYGQLDINEQLTHLEEYFSEFTYQDCPYFIEKQAPLIAPVEVTCQYTIPSGEATTNKTHFSLAYVIGESKDYFLTTALSVLSEVLMGSNASPLRKALLESNIASDMSAYVDGHLLESTFDISLVNSDIAHKETFLAIVHDTLTDLVTNGIPKKLVLAALNKIKFQIKEYNQVSQYSKGVFLASSVLSSWLYNGDPFVALEVTAFLDEVEKAVDDGLLEQLIQTKLLDNTHRVLTIAQPEYDLNDRLYQEAHEKLQTYKASLSQAEIEQLVAKTQALLLRQETPDSPESLAKLPLLSIEDIDTHISTPHLDVQEDGNVTYLHHKAFTANIVYINFKFDTRHLSADLLPYASLLASLLGNMSTEQHSLDDLTLAINTHTGGLSARTMVINESTKEQLFYPKLMLSGKVFADRASQLFDIMYDVMHHTQFNQKTRIKELLLKLKTRYEDMFNYSSHAVAIAHVKASYSQSAKYEDLCHGISYYRFICDLLAHYDARFDQLVATLQSVQQHIFNAHQLIVGTVADASDYQTLQTPLKDFVAKLNNQATTPVAYHLDLNANSAAFGLAHDVQYVAKGFNLTLVDETYTGHLRVLKTILSYTYLWNRVRVQGGAYGAFTVLSRDGDFLFASYRDPNLVNTLTTYDEASAFIAEFDTDAREMLKYIIGTISELDAPLSPQDAGEIAFLRYLTHTTDASLQKERQQVLQTTVADIRALATTVQKTIQQAHVCVLGNKQLLEEHANLFDTIETLIQ